MTTQSKWAGAAHLEEIAAEMTAINTKPDEGSYLGIEAIVEEAIEHLLTSMFPYHFGQTDVSSIPAQLKNDGIEVRLRKLN